MMTTGGLLAGPAVKPQAFHADRAPGLPPGSSVFFKTLRQDSASRPVALGAKGRCGGRTAKLDTVAEKRAFPWVPGTATGVGSMPGENPMEASRIIAGELPDLPFLAELPGRGPGADITGRAAGLLVDLPVELAGPRGWRIAERPGRDVRRARSLLSSDLDAMEEVLDGYEGPLKIQLAGPWTLAATIEQTRLLKPALADPGLVADLTSSLAEGVAIHVAEVAKRVPKATLIVQVDEPCPPRHGARCRRRAACPWFARWMRKSCGTDCTRCSPPRGNTQWCIAAVRTSRSG